MKLAPLLFFCSVSFASLGQLRYSKLVLERGQTFSFEQSDILVVDTLIMKDSSSIILNHLKKENYLYAKKAVFGKDCSINGNGNHGKHGVAGLAGNSFNSPCKDASNGEDAKSGAQGAHATSLLIYIKEIEIDHPLSVFLNGGNGGNGGKGGDGGDAGSGTIHCSGGNGGNGGKGGDGANCGNGGDLVINISVAFEAKVKNQIRAYLKSGAYGRGGYSGSGGLGPKGKNGKNGLQGEDGRDGLPGTAGKVVYFDY